VAGVRPRIRHGDHPTDMESPAARPAKTGIVRSASLLHPTTEASAESRPCVDGAPPRLKCASSRLQKFIIAVAAPHGREHDAIAEAPLQYVPKASGWRNASILLRVYARLVPEDITPVSAGQPAATLPQPEVASAGGS
jgi:hypothetical protein